MMLRMGMGRGATSQPATPVLDAITKKCVDVSKRLSEPSTAHMCFCYNLQVHLLITASGAKYALSFSIISNLIFMTHHISSQWFLSVLYKSQDICVPAHLWSLFSSFPTTA